MATILLTIPDAQMPRAIDALCLAGGWRTIELDGARGAFAKAMVIRFIRETTLEVEKTKATKVAVEAIIPSAAIIIE